MKHNMNKTKEGVMDYQRNRRLPVPVTTQGEEVERVGSYKYLGVHINCKLDWSHNKDTLFKKGQSKMFFLRRLGSFGVCSKLLRIIYQPVVASALFFCFCVLVGWHQDW